MMCPSLCDVFVMSSEVETCLIISLDESSRSEIMRDSLDFALLRSE